MVGRSRDGAASEEATGPRGRSLDPRWGSTFRCNGSRAVKIETSARPFGRNCGDQSEQSSKKVAANKRTRQEQRKKETNKSFTGCRRQSKKSRACVRPAKSIDPVGFAVRFLLLLLFFFFFFFAFSVSTPVRSS